MTFSDTAMMELGITQSTDTHNKTSLIRTSRVCQRHHAAGRNQQVEGYKNTHTRLQQMPAVCFFMKSEGTRPCILLCFNFIYMALYSL